MILLAILKEGVFWLWEAQESYIADGVRYSRGLSKTTLSISITSQV